MDKYFVLGNPIAQSKSPSIHTHFAKITHQELIYDKLLVPISGFNEQIELLRNTGCKGANVTMPFKEQAMALSDNLSLRAKMAGAVNTLTFEENGSISGDNTDGVGLVADLLAHNVKLNSANILIIGAGGAVKGVVLPLLEQHPHTIVITNRTKSKAEDIVNQYNDPRLTASALSEINQPNFDIIINATSTSLTGGLPEISSNIFKANVVCYDMVYGSGLTKFNQWAKDNGVETCIDGLGMLVAQAAESFFIWRGVRPNTEELLKSLRRQMVVV